MTTEDLSYIHPSLQSLARPIPALTPDPKNARKHDRRNIDTIKASLVKFGMRSAIVAQQVGDALIVRAGNGRLQAAGELGWTHLPVLVFAEGDAEAAAFAIADNRTAELAEWDFDVLSESLQEIRDVFSVEDMTQLGWTADELSVLTSPSKWQEPTARSERSPAAPSQSTLKVDAPTEYDVDVARDIELGVCPDCRVEYPLSAFAQESKHSDTQ